MWVPYNQYLKSILYPLLYIYSLHACARFNPPALIVKVLLELLPESPSFVDCLSRTPLHIAAGTRANFSIMQLLVAAYPMACATLDTDGKTPLHLACDSACSLFMDDEGCERDPPSTDVVSTMINTWPPVVCWEDNYGKSALEYAILSGAPIEVVRLLQAVTCLQSKKQEQEVQSRKKTRRVS
jgi:ankyrin repeat protein